MSAARRCIATIRVAEIVALVDRMRAAALIAPPGYGADADRHDVFAELAGRDFLRLRLASGSADAAPFAELAGPDARHAGRATTPTR